MVPVFAPEERWWGGHYELELGLGPRSSERLIAALRAVWAHPALEGPYGDPEREPNHQPLLDPAVGVDHHLVGVAPLPGGARVPCGTVAIRLAGEQTSGAYQQDNLSFYLPVGGLQAAWPRIGRFPFPEPADENDHGPLFPDRWRRVEDRAWQEPLEEWLAGIGRSVFERSPFRVGLVGFEVDVDDEAWNGWIADSTARDTAPFGILWPSDGNLEWHPSSVWGRYEPGWGDERPPLDDVAR